MTNRDYKDFAYKTFRLNFKDINQLIIAFTHRSYINEHKKSADEHNERLEFLGDAVLELVTTEYLYNKYDQPEGVMTAWRSALVRTESIGAVAESLGFEKMLRLSRGEKAGTKRARQQILANTFEAVVGSIYIDQGYKAAKKFITDNLLITLDKIIEDDLWRDAKSQLQEVAQSRETNTPQYKILSEEGPDHDKTFVVGVYVGKNLRGEGSGHSKQIAQQQAARSALENHYNKKTN